MVYPADDTRVRLALLRGELRATGERARVLVEEAKRLRVARAARQQQETGLHHFWDFRKR
jgi:hypothetical protein